MINYIGIRWLGMALFVAAMLLGFGVSKAEQVERQGSEAGSVDSRERLEDVLPDMGGVRQNITENRNIADSAYNFSVDLAYPVLGNPVLDKEIELWAQRTFDDFKADYKDDPQDIPCEMKGTYQKIAGSGPILSIVWNLWAYTGGMHGNLAIVSFCYDTEQSKIIELRDVAADMEKALFIMSAYSQKYLAGTLGNMFDADMLKDGTAPNLNNYTSFALTPTGIRVFFEPYQVAPFAAGPQEVDIPLEELMPASPRLSLWGR